MDINMPFLGTYDDDRKRRLGGGERSSLEAGDEQRPLVRLTKGWRCHNTGAHVTKVKGGPAVPLGGRTTYPDANVTMTCGCLPVIREFPRLRFLERLPGVVRPPSAKNHEHNYPEIRGDERALVHLGPGCPLCAHSRRKVRLISTVRSSFANPNPVCRLEGDVFIPSYRFFVELSNVNPFTTVRLVYFVHSST